jgi:uncharacterized membrane protein
MTSWFEKNYLWIICCFLSLYLGISFLAPIAMHFGWTDIGDLIYKIYSPFCHQLAFRSWFLFGLQAYYPRQLVEVNMVSYEQITGDTARNFEFARSFAGNEIMGYKVALCQRDISIYGSLLFIGFLFQMTGKKIKSIPWWIWIVIGLVPIAIDGITQFGGLGIHLFSFLPNRESTPLLRTITGTLFGSTTGLFLFPLLEETMVLSNREKNLRPESPKQE